MKKALALLLAFIAGMLLNSVLPVYADLLVGSGGTDSILRFDETTGAFIDAFVPPGSGGLDNPLGMTFGPDGNLYVSSRFTNSIMRYDGTTGAFIDIFASGSGLAEPHGLAFGPDGNLYVSSGADRVLRFNGTTGAFIDTFASGGGLSFPTALIFGPDGNLYVSSSLNNRVLRYDGTTGAFIDTFASGGGLSNAQGLDFGPDGNLYVGSFNTDSVLRYDGTTGAFIDAFVSSGSGGLNAPVDVEFGPDGNLYVQSSQSARVVRYDGTTGAFIDTFEGGGLSGQGYLLFTQSISDNYPVLSKTKIKVKGLGKIVETDNDELIFLDNGTFSLDLVTGIFSLDSKGKKILLEIDAPSLAALAGEFAGTISDLAFDKKGVFIDRDDITVAIEEVKIIKIKIDKATRKPKGKFKITINGIASADVAGEGVQQWKLSFKGKYTIQ